MKIAVCVKQVPDSAAKLVAVDGKANWGDSPLIINPWDEYAVEAALQQAEAHNGSVIAVSMGERAQKKPSNMLWQWVVRKPSLSLMKL